jgi:hypothetical protein
VIGIASSATLAQTSGMIKVALLLLLFCRCAFAQNTKIGSWSEKAAELWWSTHSTVDEIRAGADELHAALIETQGRHGVSKAMTNEHFLKWSAHLRWLRAIDGNEARVVTFRKLGHPALKQLQPLSVTLTSHDNVPIVAENLCRIFDAQPKEFLEYRNLAMALALVFDQPFPEAWPHPYVERSQIPSGDLDVEKRFAFYVASMAAGNLLLDPRQLTVRELVFVVDSMVELRELAYAQQVKLGTTQRLEQLYPVVPYDQARISQENYMWQGEVYRLFEIGTKGGICVDQAYFVGQTGKAQGVPTVFFLGQGRSGGHAWVGFLRGKEKWVLDVARYEGQDYPVGLTFDPQTWTRLTDAQLRFQIEAETNGAGFARGRLILQWALLNPKADFYREVVAMARKAMPACFEVWELEGQAVSKSEMDEREKQSFWNAWIANFDKEIDMKSRGQRMLLRSMRVAGDEAGANKLQKKIVAENRNKRFDLGIALEADVVFEMVDSGDWVGAQKEMETVLRRFGRNAGGHLFYNLLEPYVRRCLQEKKITEAQSVLKAADDFEAAPGSILDTDIKRLRSEVSALKK